jgi:hypothetical protein
LLQLSVLLSNPFVQILPLQIGKLGRKQPGISDSLQKTMARTELETARLMAAAQLLKTTAKESSDVPLGT